MPDPRPRGGWVNPYAPGNHITYITHPAGFRVLSGQAHTMQDGPVQDDARRSVESPVRETDQAADDARRGVEPPVRAADQEYQDTLYSESEVQHCIERTDKNLMDMQECIEMLQMWLVIVPGVKFAADTRQSSQKVTEIQGLSVANYYTYDDRAQVAAKMEICIRSGVALQQVSEAVATCRKIIEPFIDSEEEIEDESKEEELSELDEKTFFMKPKTKKHAAPKSKNPKSKQFSRS